MFLREIRALLEDLFHEALSKHFFNPLPIWQQIKKCFRGLWYIRIHFFIVWCFPTGCHTRSLTVAPRTPRSISFPFRKRCVFFYVLNWKSAICVASHGLSSLPKQQIKKTTDYINVSVGWEIQVNWNMKGTMGEANTCFNPLKTSQKHVCNPLLGLLA